MRSQIITGTLMLFVGLLSGWLLFGDPAFSRQQSPGNMAFTTADSSLDQANDLSQLTDMRTAGRQAKDGPRHGHGQRHVGPRHRSGHGGGHHGARSGQGGHGGGHRVHGGRHGSGHGGYHRHGRHGGHGGQRGSGLAVADVLDVEGTLAGLSRALPLTLAEQERLRPLLVSRDTLMKRHRTELRVAINALDRVQPSDDNAAAVRETHSAQARAALDNLTTVIILSRNEIYAELNAEQRERLLEIRRSGIVDERLSHWP
ncbi:MAG: hypothetical protein AAF724_06145 [Pseudomonadota bacterium]